MMVSCSDIVRELWDYLDGELPTERAAAIADHLSACARCYPQYRFEYAFLAAVARQRAAAPAPSAALVQNVSRIVIGDAARATARPNAPVAEARRPAPRVAAPVPARGAALGPRVRTERWALALLRASLGAFLLLGVGRTIGLMGTLPLSPALVRTAAVLEGALAALVVIGAWRRWSYGAALAVHVGTLLLLWGQLGDPWGAMIAGLPACAALVTLYLLRDRDAWTLDTWLGMRRPSTLAT